MCLRFIGLKMGYFYATRVSPEKLSEMFEANVCNKYFNVIRTDPLMGDDDQW